MPDDPIAIFRQVADGDAAGVTAALEADPSLASLRLDDGRTLLHTAVVSKSKDMVEIVLQYKVDVSATDEQGQDALMYAAGMDLTEIVQVLLRNRANPKAVSKSGASAIIAASTNGSPETLMALIKGGANIEQTGVVILSTSAGAGHLAPTPLQIALLEGRGQIVQTLLEAGANARKREEATGWNSLHFAIMGMSRRTGDIDPSTLQQLLERGASPHAKDEQGMTAVDLARNSSLDEAVRLLEAVPKKRRWFW